MKTDIEQGTDQWYKARIVMLTASHAQAIASNGKGLETEVMRLMQEYYSNSEPENYTSQAMQHGIDSESSAAFLYSVETGYSCIKSPFFVYDKYPDYVGGSPDLLVNDNGLAEIKCPADKGYFDYLLSGKIPTNYEWQMQMQLLITGREWCDYVVYNENYSKKLIIKRIEPNQEKFDKLEKGFESGIQMIKDIVQKMESINEGI